MTKSNVINMFDRVKPKKEEKVESGEFDFEAQIKINQEIAEKLKAERAKHNRKTTRSYKLKS